MSEYLEVTPINYITFQHSTRPDLTLTYDELYELIAYLLKLIKDKED